MAVLSRLKPWRLALGWRGWREQMNTTTGGPYQIVEWNGPQLSVRVELIAGGRVGLAGAHRDAARRIVLEMTEAEAEALMKGIRDQLKGTGAF